MTQNLEALFEEQKKYRWTASQSAVAQRIALLKNLKHELLTSQHELFSALKKDFKKPEIETEISEVYPVLEEINHTVANLKKWMKPRPVSTPLPLIGSKTFLTREARGLVLILAPWNYPFQLLMIPLISAVAAGNCVIARGSEKTPATLAYMQKLIAKVFQRNHVSVVGGQIEDAQRLTTLPFDHIFFTGSTQVGQKVMTAASHHLSTVTLELGGKSPTVILPDAKLDDVVQKLVWAKFFNAGQTCIAPDYVLVPENLKLLFLQKIKARIEEIFGTTPEARERCPHLARLIDQNSLSRLKNLIQADLSNGAEVLIGNESNAADHYLSPTVIHQVTIHHKLMSQELFGPVLPVLTYQTVNEVLHYFQKQDKPLALYIFGESKKEIQQLLQKTTAGSTVVNHFLIQFGSPHSPVGGVGASGQGNYHGHFGFQTLTHERPVLYQGGFSLTPWLYPPYNQVLGKVAMTFLRFLSHKGP